MIKTILFDLDGTLLPINTDKFIEQYIKMISLKFKDLIDPKIFAKELMGSTKTMVLDVDPQKTNEDVFQADFTSRTGLTWEDLEPKFNDFYDSDFPKLSSCLDKSCDMSELIQKAFDLGYEVVIATKPVFPLKAVLHRLSWVNADTYNYKLITSYENMHFCKPQIKYYDEILKMVGRKPEECIMIGNDVEEDMIISELGVKTVLLTDCIVNRGCSPVKADYKLTIEELPSFITNQLAHL